MMVHFIQQLLRYCSQFFFIFFFHLYIVLLSFNFLNMGMSFVSIIGIVFNDFFQFLPLPNNQQIFLMLWFMVIQYKIIEGV